MIISALQTKRGIWIYLILSQRYMNIKGVRTYISGRSLFELERLIEIAKIQSTEASNKYRRDCYDKYPDEVVV